jgi:hypothetical protein
MQEPEDRANRPSHATSEDIPRAVEFLIQFLIRWICFGLAGGFGLLSITAWARHWTWWAAIPFSVFTVMMVVCGAAIRPRGKFRFDRVGPSIVVPSSSPHPGKRSGGESEDGRP